MTPAWLSYRSLAYALPVIIAILAVIGWVYYALSKDLASYARDVAFILSILVAFLVFYDWQRFNVNARWWIWGITFWNKKGVKLSDFELPAVIIHLVIVNSSIFTIVVDKIAFTISEAGNEKHKLNACALSGEQSFEPHELIDEVPLLVPKSHFFPIIIKPRSEKICWPVFVSENEFERLESMLDGGKYEGKLELMRVAGKPTSIKFRFGIDSSLREQYEQGSCHIGYNKIQNIS